MLVFVILVVIAIIIIDYLYEIRLIGYKEKLTITPPHEEECFSPDCKSIIKKHPSDKAILLIHGYGSTPYMYDWVSEKLYSEGYDVYAPLIPTCGVSVEEFIDINKSNYTSWFYFIDNYYLNLRKGYKTLHVLGLSQGGAMALELGEKYSNSENRMNSLVTIAAPVVFNSLLRDGIITEPLGYICRFSMHFIPTINAKALTSHPTHNDGDEKWVGFGGVYTKQAVSLMYALRRIRKNLSKVEVPLISFHCPTDKTVPYKNLKIIEKETSSKAKKVVTVEMGKDSINSHHVLLHYNSVKEKIYNDFLPFIKRFE